MRSEWGFSTAMMARKFSTCKLYGLYFREKAQIQALVAALPISAAAQLEDPAGDSSAVAAAEDKADFQRLPAITAVFAAEAAVALLHTKHYLYRPIARLLKRRQNLTHQEGPNS